MCYVREGCSRPVLVLDDGALEQCVKASLNGDTGLHTPRSLAPRSGRPVSGHATRVKAPMASSMLLQCFHDDQALSMMHK